ncbi:lantibiotic dehydratase [Streptomyces sp. NRRL S-350]|uniref:lantibiotic dehydratase n=1 Tax=Streptomyces sp. NRRL S-350 TaxID=1463902 RepID=UPI00068EB096|nr:lantibiotic dehydratase [Streptomyces sp. NRRL S-350]
MPNRALPRGLPPASPPGAPLPVLPHPASVLPQPASVLPQPAPEPARGPTATTARHALVRATVLARPAQPAAAAAVRGLLAELGAVEAADHALRPAVCDDLYASRTGHDEDFHRRVVLPLRRDLYNGRPPRAALLDRLDGLPQRLPRLAAWLDLRQRRTRVLAALADALPPALAAERTALADLCREPAFARAVALTSGDLLRAVTRTARGAGTAGAAGAAGERSGRARKEEAAVLRHALRATTKTSPLSWFTAVDWAPADGRPDGPAEPPRAVVRENRTLVAALVRALLDDPRRSRTLPHRMAGAARVADGRAHYPRSEEVFAGGRYLVTREEEVALAARPELALLASIADTPGTPDRLATRLAAALGRPDADPAVHRFVGRLLAARLLVPTDPVDPQDPQPLRSLAAWLRQWPEDATIVTRIDRLIDCTAQWAEAPGELRPALLAVLDDAWRTLLAHAGRPVPADAAPLTVLSEDVHAPAPPQPRPTGADRSALAELTALAELFDHGHLMRRAARDRFVARYGPGGVCATPWEFGADAAQAWADTAVPDELASVRAEFTTMSTADGELVLPAEPVRALAARLPDWTAARPLSYSWFVQRDTVDGPLCVNHVYGGWGRFTSRFLDAGASPRAAADVARQIRRGLGDGARAAQIRPVGGFNANLHPLLLADEIGPDRQWTSLAEADLDLVHDTATDQLRLRLRRTGELLDVLYLGFLAPLMLPQRLAPLLADHPNGVVDFRPVLPRTAVTAPGGTVTQTPRLRHRHVVLARRRWHLPAAVLDTLRADLAADPGPGSHTGGVPAAAAARWRALLGLPEQLFLHPVPAATTTGTPADAFVAHLRAPKPQPVDLGNPLHLHHLAKWLTRYPNGVVLEEALPAIAGTAEPTRAVELVVETYRPGRAGVGAAREGAR